MGSSTVFLALVLLTPTESATTVPARTTERISGFTIEGDVEGVTGSSVQPATDITDATVLTERSVAIELTNAQRFAHGLPPLRSKRHSAHENWLEWIRGLGGARKSRVGEFSVGPSILWSLTSWKGNLRGGFTVVESTKFNLSVVAQFFEADAFLSLPKLL
ncbi:hypothetical protein B0H11DRAFT_2392731 [Mycena galericulata]|nr:hypothetical protein B0H11DRAFT_2392731 [Mycena galericulata]